MEEAEWFQKCAQRLHQQWPQLDQDDLEHLAKSLWTEERWKRLDPDEAALTWLRLSMPSAKPAQPLAH
jgi:hypothetical protein